MRVSMAAMVGVVVVLFAFWMGRAEAQHRGGKAAPAHLPKGGAGKAHPSPPKAKAPQKANGGVAKPAQKKQQGQDSTKAKHDEKKKDDAKKHSAKQKAKEHAKKAEKKAPAAHGGSDQDSVALLHAAHQKLHEADHDYAGHRRRSMEHVGAALDHLGSSASASFRPGTGRNLPQSVSDGIMRQAKASLEKIRTGLTARTSAAGGHGPARGTVDAANREIDLALTLR